MKTRYRKQAPEKRKSFGSTLIGLFVGLVIGVLVAAGVVWYLYKTPPPFSSKFQASSQGAATAAPPAAVLTPAPTTAAAAPMPLPGKPGDPIPKATPQDEDKPRFDFYKILPGNADAVPDSRGASTEKKPGSDTEKKSGNEKEALLAEALYLQTGSFQNVGDADAQKARLAMAGMEASVQQVMLQDKVWYRVRLGPFRKMDDVSTMRAELARQGIEANVVK